MKDNMKLDFFAVSFIYIVVCDSHAS
jgi:hypothetical protein